MNADELIPTRQSLLSRLKDWEDSDSWREFFQTYWHLIYNVAVKAGLTDAEAQEVVQETLIAVAKKMPNFRYDPAVDSFKGWLLQITRWNGKAISSMQRWTESKPESIPNTTRFTICTS